MSIDQLEFFEVNGTKQWILERGQDRTKPLILFVHGGPGSPLMWFSRAWDAPFLNDFVVVHWDQRGSGKSFDPSISPDSYTLDQIVADGLKVTELLRSKFHRQKIILAGHSWGSMVAAHMTVAKPEYFQALVSIGTATDQSATEGFRYDLVKEKVKNHQDETLKTKLVEVGPPPYTSSTKIREFGELFLQVVGWSGTSRKYTLDEFTAAVMKTKEYSEADFERANEGMNALLDVLGPSLNTYDANEAVPRIEVPVYFAQGSFDLNTPTHLARAYFERLSAPVGKRWFLFSNSAHFPMYEEPEEFLALLKRAASD